MSDNHVSIKEATAWHEAGHAMAALYYGVGIKRVSIDRSDIDRVSIDRGDGNVAGFVSHGYESIWTAQEIDAFHKAVILFAGFAAECRYLGIEHGEDARAAEALGGAWADIMAIGELFGVTMPTKDDRIAAVRDKAVWIINEYWDLIEIIAKGLLDNGSLTGEEIVDLFRSAVDAARARKRA